MRFAIDSNVLVYSLVADDPRHQPAVDVLRRAVHADCVLPLQVLGEFLNVIKRKLPGSFDLAYAQAARLGTVMATVETRAAALLAGAQLASRHKLQFWDSVLCEVVRTSGAQFLLSEDMQDGREIDGLQIVNPFAERNRALLAEMLVPVA